MSTEATHAALRVAQALPVELITDPMLHESALGMAEHFGLSATYDAHYLALAAEMGAEYWTANRRLEKRVQPSLSWVHLVE